MNNGYGFTIAILTLLLTAPAEAQQIERLLLEGRNEWATVGFELYGEEDAHSIWGNLLLQNGQETWFAHRNFSIDFHRTRIELEFHVPANPGRFIPTYGSIGEIASDADNRRFLMSGVCEILPSLALPELVECGLTMQFSEKPDHYGDPERPDSEPKSLWILIDLKEMEIDAQQNGSGGGERLIPGTLQIVDR